MSYKATNWAYGVAIKAPAKPVLVALADAADEAHSCFPSQQTLASMTGFDERTVRRAIGSLEAIGAISRERRHDSRGRRTSDRFILAVGSALAVRATTGQSDHRSESPNLPDGESEPTGQSDLGTISEPSENHQLGGQSDQWSERPVAHVHEENARRALTRIRQERSLPLPVRELLRYAYRIGDGDPWDGFKVIDQLTERALVGAANPAAVLRKRLEDAA